jgi:adenylate cyclase
MTCPGCGFEAAADFTFCPGCGRRLPATCASCGFVCAPDFSFCPRCGTAVGGAARSGPETPAVAVPRAEGRPAARPEDGSREADRRLVTVVFADLSGFTALAERLDAEEVRSFQNALFETFASVIARYDGFVEKFVGDAVLAVFGAPVAHEDDPERALNASLAMLERCTALSHQWAPRLGRAVTLHIGVHTGPVVAGSLGTAAGDSYTVTGDTVNTTARLVAAAAPGTVLVSESTHMFTRHCFAFAPGGELALRGKSDPVRVYQLLGLLTEPGSSRGLAALGLTAPLVGRSDHLEQLVAAFERMRQGRAQVVSLVGEAGAGKSRLIAELLARLEAEGGSRARPSVGWPARPSASRRMGSSGRYFARPMELTRPTRWRSPARSWRPVYGRSAPGRRKPTPSGRS